MNLRECGHFLGHSVSREGVKPDTNKIEGIRKMEVLDVCIIFFFLVMVVKNFLGRYLAVFLIISLWVPDNLKALKKCIAILAIFFISQYHLVFES